MSAFVDSLLRYQPSGRLGLLSEIKGSLKQVPALVATAAGVKPAMDDWVQIGRLGEYRQLVGAFGLMVREDVVFAELTQEEERQIVGSELLTTTHARAIAGMDASDLRSEMHVFLARDRTELDEAYRLGWYTLVCGQRVVRAPITDREALGGALGYPECCVRFFMRENDWGARNHYFAVAENTRGQGCYLVNHLSRRSGFSYVSHIPCSFSCAATKAYAKAVRAAIQREDSAYSRLIDAALQMPYLVCSENRVYLLDGELDGPNAVRYSGFLPMGSMAREDEWCEDLARGDRLAIEENIVFVTRGGRPLSAFEARADWSPVENPIIVRLTEGGG